MKSWFGSIIALALLCTTSATSSAGVISARLEVVDPSPTEITVGDAVRVSVSLDGLRPRRPSIWAVRVGVPDGFTTPSEIEFPREPVIHGMGTFSGGPASLTNGFAAIVFPSFRSAPTSFSFVTTALQPGSWTFDVLGFATRRTPGRPMKFFTGLQDTLELEVQSSASNRLGAAASPPLLSSPEPTSAAIFATLAGTLLLRRQRR